MAVIVAVIAMSCGGGDDGATMLGTTGDASVGAGGGGAGASGRGGQSGTLVIGPIDGGPLLTVDAMSGAVGGSLEDSACASETRQGEQLPLDLYIMLDSSASMTGFLADGVTTKWDAVRTALRSFVNDPASRGLGVGLQYFPLFQANIPASCLAAGDCAQAGPCDLPRTCSGGATVVPCATVADCPAGEQCILLGACRTPQVPGTLDVCAPAGALCAANNPCLQLPGYCRLRDACTMGTYAAPAVEVAALPAAAAGITTSLNAHLPDGLTPTAAALTGALTHARALALASPTHRVAVVLATDGLPTECTPLDIPGIATLASNAAAATPAISTFVIGVFSPAEAAFASPNLNALATAGRTSSAYIVDTSQDVSMQFLNALNSIRTSALACEYTIPQPQAGQLDFGKVNVQFTSGTGQSVTIGYVASAAQCTVVGGWYYDVDPSTGGTPTKIVVCDATCNGFKTDPTGTVKILLGCNTQAIVR